MILRAGLGFVLFVATIACGGGASNMAASPDHPCEEDAEKLLDRAPVCDSQEIEPFRTEIETWTRNCNTSVSSDRIARALADSVSCTRKRSQSLTKAEKCNSRTDAIEKQKDCSPDRCQALADALRELAAECHVFKDAGFNLGRASALHAEITARIEAVEMVAALSSQEIKCKAVKQLAESGKPGEAFDLLRSAMKSPPKPAHLEVESVLVAKTAADVACDGALGAAADPLFERLAARLNDKDQEKEVLIWIAAYQQLSKMSGQLKDVPGSNRASSFAKQIDELLARLANKYSELLQGESSGKESASKKVLLTAAEHCAARAAQIARFKAKIAEHTALGNEKKVNAYSAKLAGVEDALQALVERIDTARGLKPFDDEKTATLIAAARSEGCPIP